MSRKRPPQRRRSENFKVKAGRRSVFFTIGYGDDGRPCELFIDTAREGSELTDIMDAFAMMVSLALQNGTPLSEVVNALKDFRKGELPQLVGATLAVIGQESEAVA